MKYARLFAFIIPLTISAAAMADRGGGIEITASPSDRARLVTIPSGREADVHIEKDFIQLDDLICITERNLQRQRELQEVLKSYLGAREEALRNPRNNEALYRQSLFAKKAMDQIEENHWEQLFSKELLSELNMFSRVANRRVVPRP